MGGRRLLDFLDKRGCSSSFGFESIFLGGSTAHSKGHSGNSFTFVVGKWRFVFDETWVGLLDGHGILILLLSGWRVDMMMGWTGWMEMMNTHAG